MTDNRHINREDSGSPDPRKLIAAVGTLIAALLLLLCALLVRVNFSPLLPGKDDSSLEMAAIEPEEVPEFIEPLLMEDAGEKDAEVQEDPAPVPDGMPDPAPRPVEKKVVNGDNPSPSPSTEKLVKQKQPSSKKTAEPDPKPEPDSRIAGRMQGQFSPHNGKPGGSSQPSARSGSGGTGSGATGTLRGGRKLLSCPMPTVTLRQKVVIKVEVYVDAEGRVTEANVISGSSDATLREKCRRASLSARWTPKADAPRTRGVITWTLVPKI